MNPTIKVSGIILAGGKGTRAGGKDKGLLLYNNKPLIKRVINAITPQVDDIVISANRNIDSYKQYNASVIGDTKQDYQGPLAGITACISHCKHKLILIVACDMPNLPADLSTRLTNAIENNAICITTVDGHHQLAMLINANVKDSAQKSLDKQQLKLMQWVQSLPYATVSFDDKPDAFLNLNHLNNPCK